MPPRTQSILLAAVVYAVISVVLAFIGQAGLGTGASIAVGALGCLIGLAIAAMAVWHYTSTHNVTIPAGPGAGMGALAIVAGVILAQILQYGLVAAGVLMDPQEAILDTMEAQGASQAEIDMALRFSGPLLATVFGVVIGAVIGAVGGAIGASIFKKGGEA